MWKTLAEKYAVRQYVADRIGEQYLVPLLGKWDTAEAIDFDALPDKFVIKPNNGSYDCVVCSDKSTIDVEEVRARMARSLRVSFGIETAEPHYRRIKPCIIAEQMLETDAPEGLVDYKIWCFNGRPYCFFVCANRDPITHHVVYLYYDLNWVKHRDYISEAFRTDVECPRPKNLEKMLEIATKLSEGLPEARVDLYDIDGRIYFGEMTMTSNFAMMPFYTKETLERMGDQVQLPERSAKEKLKAFLYRTLPTI